MQDKKILFVLYIGSIDLKRFVPQEIYFSVVQKLKFVFINVINFCRNSAPKNCS